MRWLVVVIAGCGAGRAAAPPPAATVENRAAEAPVAELDVTYTPGAAPKEYDPPPAAWGGRTMPQMSPTECGGKGGHVDVFDFDGNAKPEVVKVFLHDELLGTEYLRCKHVDFDQDGSPDATTVYSTGGTLLLEVFDLDFDQLADMANKLDGATGKMVTIRDTDRDGAIDP